MGMEGRRGGGEGPVRGVEQLQYLGLRFFVEGYFYRVADKQTSV